MADSGQIVEVNGLGELGEERPYMKWEGPPFYQLETRTQTEDQWLVSLFVSSAFVFVLFIVLLAAGEPLLALFFLGFMLIVGTYLWKSGRRGAQR